MVQHVLARFPGAQIVAVRQGEGGAAPVAEQEDVEPAPPEDDQPGSPDNIDY